MNTEFLDKIKVKLLAEKERVDGKIADLTAPENREANPDWDDTANDAIEDVEQESLLRIYRGLQERVEAALTRIEDGTYGLCADCQTPIPEENLEKEPWAEHCGTCRKS